MNDQNETNPVTKTNITHYDFPTVPIQKFSVQHDNVEINKQEERQSQKEEPVLFEL